MGFNALDTGLVVEASVAGQLGRHEVTCSLECDRLGDQDRAPTTA